MRFQQDGKIYDTETSVLIWQYDGPARWADSMANGRCAYYRSPRGTYFKVQTLFESPTRWLKWMHGWYQPKLYGHRISEREIACAAFDHGVDPVSLGLPPLEVG